MPSRAPCPHHPPLLFPRPRRYDETFSEFEDYVEARQDAVDEAGGADPGLASVVAAFLKAKKLSGEALDAFK